MRLRTHRTLGDGTAVALERPPDAQVEAGWLWLDVQGEGDHVEDVVALLSKIDAGALSAQTVSREDELMSVRCDLDRCATYEHTLFNCDRYRRPEVTLHPGDPVEILEPRDDLPEAVPDHSAATDPGKEQP